MKRPTELIEKAKGFKSTDPIRVLAEYAVSLESPRKTVSDAVDYYDGVWPDFKYNYIRASMENGALIGAWNPDSWDGWENTYQVCTRKEFEAEVERRNGEEWTHKDGVSECNVIATHGGLSWVKYKTGENYVVRNDCLKRRKPCISKAEAWDKLMEKSMNSSEVNTIKRDYDIV